MVEILNTLKDYCKDCEYMNLKCAENLGSGRTAYKCRYENICDRLYKKLKTDMIHQEI